MPKRKALTTAQIQQLVSGLEVTVEPIGRLQEYAGNAKEHTAEQVEQIKPQQSAWSCLSASRR